MSKLRHQTISRSCDIQKKKHQTNKNKPTSAQQAQEKPPAVRRRRDRERPELPLPAPRGHPDRAAPLVSSWDRLHPTPTFAEVPVTGPLPRLSPWAPRHLVRSLEHVCV